MWKKTNKINVKVNKKSQQNQLTMGTKLWIDKKVFKNNQERILGTINVNGKWKVTFFSIEFKCSYIVNESEICEWMECSYNFYRVSIFKYLLVLIILLFLSFAFNFINIDIYKREREKEIEKDGVRIGNREDRIRERDS